MRIAHALAAVAVAALFGASQANAHAKLITSDPAAGSRVAAPKQLTLKFSEKLQPRFSTAHLTMPSMNDMEVSAKVSVASDGKTMTVTPSKALLAGAYKLHWVAVAADTHKMEGDLSFTVG